jgi:hypothetical protein
MRILILAALASLFAGCASAPPPPPPPPEHLFSELQPGDRIHVHFRSVGCYHNVAYTFDFERGARATVRIKSLGRAWSPVTPDFETQIPHLLGTLTLSARDLRGLDNLVQFYRTHPDGFCSTAEDITIKYPQYFEDRPEPVIVTERYTDLSCDNFRLPGLTTFPSLAQRLERRGK